MNDCNDTGILGDKIKKVNPSIEVFAFNLIDKTQRTGTEFKRFLSFVHDCLKI
jgi:hypothetical protein